MSIKNTDTYLRMIHKKLVIVSEKIILRKEGKGKVLSIYTLGHSSHRSK